MFLVINGVIQSFTLQEKHICDRRILPLPPCQKVPVYSCNQKIHEGLVPSNAAQPFQQAQELYLKAGHVPSSEDRNVCYYCLFQKAANCTAPVPVIHRCQSQLKTWIKSADQKGQPTSSIDFLRFFQFQPMALTCQLFLLPLQATSRPASCLVLSLTYHS